MAEKLDISADTQLVETQALLAFYQNRCLVLAQVGNDLHKRNQMLEAENEILKSLGDVKVTVEEQEPDLIPSKRRRTAIEVSE